MNYDEREDVLHDHRHTNCSITIIIIIISLLCVHVVTSGVLVYSCSATDNVVMALSSSDGVFKCVYY